MKKLIEKNEEEYIKDLKSGLVNVLQELNHRKDFPEVGRNMLALSTMELDYHTNMIIQLLELEEYIDSEDEALSIARLICSEALKKTYKPLLKKRFDERIIYINSMITDLQISRDDVAGRSEVDQYEETDCIIHGLTFENTSPLILFEQFINHFGIQFSIDDKDYLFKYHLTNDTLPNIQKDKLTNWYRCNTLHEMLAHIANILISDVIDSVLSFLDSSCYSVRIPVSNYINKEFLNNCKNPRSIYNYLKTVDIARMNLMLQHIFLLIDFDKFPIFKNTDIMNQIYDSLKQHEPNDEKGYSYALLYETLSNISKVKI